MPVHQKQRGQPESDNDCLGLMANGCSGEWEISVDETTEGSERWFIQLEGSAVYISFEIPSPEIIATALQFLEGHLLPKEAQAQSCAENGSLDLGKYRQIPVILVRDNEYTDRFFLVIGQEADVVARFTIAGQDLKDIQEVLSQAIEDLEMED